MKKEFLLLFLIIVTSSCSNWKIMKLAASRYTSEEVPCEYLIVRDIMDTISAYQHLGKTIPLDLEKHFKIVDTCDCQLFDIQYRAIDSAYIMFICDEFKYSNRWENTVYGEGYIVKRNVDSLLDISIKMLRWHIDPTTDSVKIEYE